MAALASSGRVTLIDAIFENFVSQAFKCYFFVLILTKLDEIFTAYAETSYKLNCVSILLLYIFWKYLGIFNHQKI